VVAAIATFVAHHDKKDSAYAPSFSVGGADLGDRQRAVHEAVQGIDGWLDPVDALKLYEIGCFADGPFLEIGTYRGKATTVLASALRDSRRHVPFYSLDIARDDLELARASLAERGLGAQVTLVHGSIAAFLRASPAFRPRFVFVDGDHSASGVGRDLASLEQRIPAGGLLLFHDYLDVRNDDAHNRDYGVTQAIRNSWVARDCEFAGTFGCAGLYRRSGGPTAAEAGRPDVLELMRLDRLPIRLRIEAARPAKRFLMRKLGRTTRRNAG
jgi:hypothetical protein